MKKRTALITGGSRGIGLGIAQHLAQQGFNLAINGVRAEDVVQETLQPLREAGAEVIYCRGDIAAAAEREQVLQKTYGHFGELHVLVNNAGVAPKERKDVLETTEESYDRLLDTNLKGAFFLTQSVANRMIATPGLRACIINISSISATVASINRGEYCIAKAGLSMMTQLFAVRLGPHGIPVYEVRPGVIATDMTTGVQEKYDRLIADGLLVQPRWGLPDDVGKAVAMLASGALPYSTGQVVMVDGGLTISRL
ncbi:3-ketoacyl-ACP reductase [Chitinophaga sp. GCM10012297]|uniref:3-ketoacyl-ACP reductase n=1 Tax=Chitinophaga chungangae TaxID=2821488 RepID=A0ABS3YAZ2_9BACT|nr:3-ketoacyl-ACP reductase [Chitinophaga chungangae]MBO9151847.1 3-ketoacyl-ACP reductase [Chitinophaga chungangae]